MASGLRLKVEIRNQHKLARTLNSLPAKIAKKCLRRGSREAAKIAQRHLRAIAPYETGALRKTLKVRSMRRSRRYVGAVVASTKKEGLAFYGAFLEWGVKWPKYWRGKPVKNPRQGYRIKGKAWMRKGFQSKKPAMMRQFRKAFYAELRKIAIGR